MYRQPEINLRPDEVLIYLRKSRSDDPLLTVEEVLKNHETILDEWAVKNLGGKVPTENKFREVVSGETLEDRPEISKLLKLIESPKYKAVLIVEVQRLSRGDLEDAGRLIKLFRFTNTQIFTPQKIYDIRDEYDRDTFERELKRGNEYLEYTKKIMSRGRLLAVSQGNYIGSVAPYGYDRITIKEGKTKCHTLKIKEDEANIVRLIFDMFVNKGYGRNKICKTLDEMKIKPPTIKQWSPSAVREILVNVHYIGKVRWNWRKTISIIEDGELIKKRPQSKIGEYLIFEGKQDAIIDEKLFNAAQEMIGRNPRTKANAKLVNPFANITFCKKCGYVMVMQSAQSKGAPRMVCSRQSRCGMGSCLYEEFEKSMCEVLAQCIEDFEIRIQNDDADSRELHRNLIKQLESKLEELSKKELSQWEAQSHPDPAQRMPVEIFKRLNENLLREKEEVTQALCKAKDNQPEPVDYEEKIYRFRDALEALKDSEKSAEEKNILLKKCFDRIEYHREKPERIKGVKARNAKGQIISQWTNPPIILDVKLRV